MIVGESKMKKIKVLMVAGSMHIGGIENQLMHLARNADKEKFQIDFTSTMPDAFYREEIEQLGGKFILIPPMNWKWPFPYCKAMYQIIKDYKYDVVHSNELFHSGIVMMIAKVAGVKVRITHSHSVSDTDGTVNKRSFFRALYNIVMRNCILKYSTVQIACSITAGKFLFGEECIQQDTFHLIYNSIDTEKYIEKYNQVEGGEFCDDGWINVLHVGRVYPVKRQLFDVEIAEKFKETGKRIRILCAGNAYDADYMKQIQNVIIEKNLQDYMIMLGSRDDVDVLFRKSSVVILPSAYEGMPLVLLEAQATGLHCIVADTFSREVDFDINLIIWMDKAASIEEWADAIEKVACLKKTDKKQVVKSIQKKGFDSKIFAKKLCSLYMDNV